jgi:hypothetical protein
MWKGFGSKIAWANWKLGDGKGPGPKKRIRLWRARNPQEEAIVSM